MNVLDLFCGIGGGSLGLKNAGFNIFCAIDNWSKAVENYRSNFDHQVIEEDLTKLSPKIFDKLYNKKKVSIDLILASPPCQGFSNAGLRDPKDPRNSLFMEFIKYLNFYKPRAFIFENVMGILSAKNNNGEKVIDIISSILEKDYNCSINKLYASDFEVPQNRRRVIIIGVRKDLNIIPKAPEIFSKERIPVKTVLQQKNEVDKKLFLSIKAIDGIKRRKEQALIKKTGFGAQFLNPDKPSYTIPARYYKDGYDALVKYTETEIRRLSILELKRIQTFPDNFILNGSNKDIITQIGNAIPSKFMYHIGLYIINLLK